MMTLPPIAVHSHHSPSCHVTPLTVMSVWFSSHGLQQLTLVLSFNIVVLRCCLLLLSLLLLLRSSRLAAAAAAIFAAAVAFLQIATLG